MRPHSIPTTPVWMVWVLSCFLATASAQTSVKGLTDEQYARLPIWEAGERGAGATFRVDLRRFLPTIRDQGHQRSCVGWAVAYAAKTFHEVRDQGWRPDTTGHMFSPAFIYNQINGGRDHGSQVLDALKLVKNKGCATWASMPYDPLNCTQLPSSNTFREALNFKIRDYKALRRGDDMRAALADGHVVVVVVRTNPIFTGGNFRVFTSRLLRKGDDELAATGGQGDLHAMCLVGYDDSRRAFLAMNSWGTSWSQNGYGWLSYDLAREVRPVGGNLFREAYVLFDERKPIANNQAATLALNGYHWYSGIKNGRHSWRWKALLSASPQTLEGVDHVLWRFHDGASDRWQRADDQVAAFETVGTFGGLGVLTVTAEVRFRDGSIRTLNQRFSCESPERQGRNLQLVQTDRYFGRVAFGDGTDKPNWEWTLFVDGDLVSLGDVEQVTYHLHPSFPQPNRVVRDSAANGFAMTTRGWGTFEVKATVLFKDGTTTLLRRKLAFRDEVRDDLTLNNTARFVGLNNNGTNWWDWTAFVDGPLQTLWQIDRVTYHLHPTFPQPNRTVFDGPEYGFPLSTNGWGTFELRATVAFKDGSTQTLSHKLVFGGR